MLANERMITARVKNRHDEKRLEICNPHSCDQRELHTSISILTWIFFWVIIRVVNSRQTNFFIFDRTRSLSLDVHESCDFKPKKRNLNSPKNAYFRNFRLCCNFSPISTYFRKNYDFSPVSFSNLLAKRIFY